MNLSIQAGISCAACGEDLEVMQQPVMPKQLQTIIKVKPCQPCLDRRENVARSTIIKTAEKLVESLYDNADDDEACGVLKLIDLLEGRS